MERIRMNPLGSMGQRAAAPMSMPKPSFGSPVHMASRVGGAMHNYLGHFAQPQFLMAGHNTSGGATKHTGTFHGKSNKLGHGGRAAQLRARGVPEAVIGEIARRKHAAPGQRNYRGK